MDAVTPADLAAVEVCLLITSTFGDGGPPDNGEDFWLALAEPSMPRLDGLRYTVLAFGDSATTGSAATGSPWTGLA